MVVLPKAIFGFSLTLSRLKDFTMSIARRFYLSLESDPLIQG